MKHVLAVEDESEIRELMALHLKRRGVLVDEAGSVEQATEYMESREYSVILLDWMLPGISGLDFIRKLRKNPKHDQVRVLMVTAKSDPQDVVQGLNAGADDYLPKPFDPEVLLARTFALMRRSAREYTHDQESDMTVIKNGDLKIFPESYKVIIKDEEISLTTSEFKLLLALMKNTGRVLTRDKLILLVQGEGVSVTGRTIDTHIFGLRKKIGLNADLIETVRGVGYRVRVLN